ncbi:MAG: hypothetical protein WBA45_04810 [Microthrixaceae bacterium]
MTPMRPMSAAVEYGEIPTAQPTEVRQSLRLSRGQTVIVVVSMLVTALLAGVLALTRPPIYETSRSVLVLTGGNPSDSEVMTMALESLFTSKGLAAEVKRRGDLPQSIDQISSMISVERKPESPTMTVVVSSPSREESEQISAQVVPALTAVFERAQDPLAVESRLRGPIFQEVWQPLQSTSTFPLWFALVFGLLLGGLAPFLFFLARNLRRPVVESSEDVTNAIDLPILARVSALSSRGVNAQDTIAGVVSSIERLALNEPVHRLVLVGSDSGAERAEIALALACTVARSFGQPVALIDADLDGGVLTNLLGVGEGAGLAECLSGKINPESALRSLSEASVPAAIEPMRPPDGMVRFLGTGVDTSRNVLRMRSSFNRVLEALAGRYVVIVNGPRIPGPVPTAQLLSLADATLMVVTEGETSLTDAQSAGDTLRSFSSGASGIIVLRR